MPTYEITQDETGVTLELTGDRPPSEQDVQNAFAWYGRQTSPQAGAISERTPSIAERVAGGIKDVTGADVSPYIDTARAMFGGLTAQPVIQAIGRPAMEAVLGPEVARPQKPLGSVVDREGILGLLSAGERKREQAKAIGEAIGETVGPRKIGRAHV